MRRFSLSELGKGLGLSRRSRTMTHNTDKDGKAVFRPLPEKFPGLSRYYHAPTKVCFLFSSSRRRRGQKRLASLFCIILFLCLRVSCPLRSLCAPCRVRRSFFVPFRLFLHCSSPLLWCNVMSSDETYRQLFVYQCFE